MPKGRTVKTKLARKELFLAALVLVASLAALLYVNFPRDTSSVLSSQESSDEPDDQSAQQVRNLIHSTTLTIGGEKIAVDVADDPAERILGLSGVKSLEDDKGMLFVFEEAAKHGFWMKDMNFSIDIIWMDENRRIVHIEENATPASYPDVTFRPNVEALYVLELYTGQVDKRGLKLGDQANFSI